MYGRTQMDTPEEDGIIYIKTDKKLQIGEFKKVKVTGKTTYDLIGEM